MLIWLLFSNIVHPWYFPVILRADVQSNLMERRRNVKEAVKRKSYCKKAALLQVWLYKINIKIYIFTQRHKHIKLQNGVGKIVCRDYKQ